MADGYWFTDQQGERIWCASPERERCGGHGYMHCYCGGDFCCCGNQGEIECMGCPDCEYEDPLYGDDDEDPRSDPDPAASRNAQLQTQSLQPLPSAKRGEPKE